MLFGSRGKAFNVSQFITCIGAGDIKTEAISLYWWNQCFVGMCLPVPTSHSSARSWQWTPLGLCAAEVICPQSKGQPSSSETNKQKRKKNKGNWTREKSLNAWKREPLNSSLPAQHLFNSTLPHRYKGVTCSSVHQQPKSCLKIGPITTHLDQPAPNTSHNSVPGEQVCEEKLYSLAKHSELQAPISLSVLAMLPFHQLPQLCLGLGSPIPHLGNSVAFMARSESLLYGATPRRVWPIKSTNLILCSPLAC